MRVAVVRPLLLFVCLKRGRKINSFMQSFNKRFQSPIDTVEAVNLLSKDEVVALPTETVYGLAGSIKSEEALKKIFATKERPFFDPLIIHLASVDLLQDYVSYNPKDFIQKLSKAFWPGPLTLVLPKSEKVSDLITSGLDTVALRVPNHPLFLEVTKKVGPLAAPSANKFGKTSPTSAGHVMSEFNGSVAAVDGGDCSVGIESTILQINKENQLTILRPGQITAQQIAKVLGIRVSEIKKTYQGSVAPGQLKYHYQPSKPLILANVGVSKEEIIKKLGNSNIRTAEIIHLSADPQFFAREMYAAFRKGSKKNVDALILHLNINEDQEWDAINNRLSKAATWDLRV